MSDPNPEKPIEDARTKKRKNILNEIYDTELSYNMSLNDFKVNFVNKLIKLGELSEYKNNESFQNLLIELKKINYIIDITNICLSELQAVKDELDKSKINTDQACEKVAELFIRLAPALKGYDKFVNSVSNILTLLEQVNKAEPKDTEFRKIYDDLFKDLVYMDSPKPSAQSYLIMPVQRMPRYVMFLKNEGNGLLRYTDVSDSSYFKVAQALKRIEDVTSHMDESKGVYEIMETDDLLVKALRDKKTNAVARSVGFTLGESDPRFKKAFFAPTMQVANKVLGIGKKDRAQGVNYDKFAGFLSQQFRGSEPIIQYNNDKKLYVSIMIDGALYRFQVLKGEPDKIDLSDKPSQHLHVRIEHEDILSLNLQTRAKLYDAAKKIGQSVVGSLQDKNDLQRLAGIEPSRDPGAHLGNFLDTKAPNVAVTQRDLEQVESGRDVTGDVPPVVSTVETLDDRQHLSKETKREETERKDPNFAVIQRDLEQVESGRDVTGDVPPVVSTVETLDVRQHLSKKRKTEGTEGTDPIDDTRGSKKQKVSDTLHPLAIKLTAAEELAKASEQEKEEWELTTTIGKKYEGFTNRTPLVMHGKDVEGKKARSVQFDNKKRFFTRSLVIENREKLREELLKTFPNCTVSIDVKKIDKTTPDRIYILIKDDAGKEMRFKILKGKAGVGNYSGNTDKSFHVRVEENLKKMSQVEQRKLLAIAETIGLSVIKSVDAKIEVKHFHVSKPKSSVKDGGMHHYQRLVTESKSGSAAGGKRQDSGKHEDDRKVRKQKV